MFRPMCKKMKFEDKSEIRNCFNTRKTIDDEQHLMYSAASRIKSFHLQRWSTKSRITL